METIFPILGLHTGKMQFDPSEHGNIWGHILAAWQCRHVFESSLIPDTTGTYKVWSALPLGLLEGGKHITEQNQSRGQSALSLQGMIHSVEFAGRKL